MKRKSVTLGETGLPAGRIQRMAVEEWRSKIPPVEPEVLHGNERNPHLGIQDTIDQMNIILMLY